MEKRDLARFRTLRMFITVATLAGIDVLFFITMDPWEGGLWIAQLGMLCFLNVAVGFAIYWLMDYASTPDIPAKVLNPVYIHPFRSEALRLACNELNLTDKLMYTISTKYCSEHNCSMLWVTERYDKKRESRVYYYDKADKDISHS